MTRITKAHRVEILAKSGGVCWYCGDKLQEKGWHVDHVEAVYRCPLEGMQKPQNDVTENLVPACAPCNLFKGVYSVEEFRSEISLQIERARRASVNFRVAERFGLLKVTGIPVVFWFEKNRRMNAIELFGIP